MATVTHQIGTPSTLNVTSYASGAFTPPAGEILVVGVITSGTVAAAPTLVGSTGLAFTLVTQTTKLAGDTMYLFIANAPCTAVSQTVTFDCTADAATGCVIIVESVGGISRTGSTAARQLAFRTSQAAGGTPAAPFAEFTITGNPIIIFTGNASSPAGLTPPTGFTEAYDNGYATPTTGGHCCFLAAGSNGQNYVYAATSVSAYGCIGVELDKSTLPFLPLLPRPGPSALLRM